MFGDVGFPFGEFGFVPFGEVSDGLFEPGVPFGEVAPGFVPAGLFAVPGVELPGVEFGFGVASGGVVPGAGVADPGVGFCAWPDGAALPGLVVVVPPWPGAAEPLPAV